ncbi:MAG: hypothetical protein KJO78_01325, partial [Alphaproteobacteria bacterium]|nr:hypothetical protein [Alphaproteobacteria bacterium]
YGAIVLSALAVAATVDAAFGFGGAAWLADLCLTGTEEDMAAMDMTPREVKPVPLIALSLGVTASAIGFLSIEHRRASSGHVAPDNEERAGILSAMVLVAAAQGRTTRGEILNIFRIVTRHQLEGAFADLALTRYQELLNSDIDQVQMAPISSGLGRRRVLSASLLMGCVSREAPPRIEALIRRLATEIGATDDDCVAARAALDEWHADCRDVKGVSLVSLLCHRPLSLRPA